MSGTIIGIDLGTTNSCVSKQGTWPNCCHRLDNLPGFSVFTDAVDRYTIPSVLFYTGETGKPFEIGHSAKNSVGKYPPVMFAKRHMGSDKVFPIGDNLTITPENVSTEILKYLRFMAEQTLGEEINRAVVTVPAYFGMEQRRSTREALVKAGFLVDSDRYIIMEPVAAAYMYAAMTRVEELTIMVYDLGGGTFDVTVLKKDGPSIEVTAYGGDHALGGYNFDMLLADHILFLLQRKGYKLDLDPENNDGDAVIYNILLLLAEKVKIELSDEPEAYLRKPGAFEDQTGNLVDINLHITRKVFEGLISELVDSTVAEAKKTQVKANVDDDKLDEIIMVGGSSYIPLVKKRLEAAFGRKPLLVEPDLAVSLGASVYASFALGSVSTGADLRLIMEKLPTKTDKDDVAIEGTVTDLEGTLLSGYSAVVTDLTGNQKKTCKVGDNGMFLVEMDLQPNTENRFTVTIQNPEGEAQVSTEVAIVQCETLAEGEETSIDNPVFLPKALYVQTQKGDVELVPEGATLPYDGQLVFALEAKGDSTIEGTKNLKVRFYEEGREIGKIQIAEIPASVPIGAAVEISFKITRDNCVQASAFIPSGNCAGQTEIHPRALKVESSSDLRAELDRLRSEWEGLKKIASADQLAEHGVAVERDFKRAENFLKGTNPDTTETSAIMERLRNKLSQLQPVRLNPSMQAFKEMCHKVKDLIKRAESKSDQAREMNYTALLDNAIEEGNKAYSHKDQTAWKEANAAVENLGERVRGYLKEPGGGERPDPRQMYLQLQMLTRDLQQRLMMSKISGREEMLAQLSQAEEELAEIGRIRDLDEMWDREVGVYLGTLDPIIKALEAHQPGTKPGGIEVELGGQIGG